MTKIRWDFSIAAALVALGLGVRTADGQGLSESTGVNQYFANCARCHESSDNHEAPRTSVLKQMTPEHIVYTKALEGVECFQTSFTGFSPAVSDHEIRIASTKVGAGVRITGDRPMARFGYWSIRTVLAPEPYVDINIEPGKEFTWKWTYDYFVTK